MMPTTTLYTKTGAEPGTVDLPDTLFAAPSQRGRHAPGRRSPSWPAAASGTADTKTRGKVRGGGAKPYRQKGTGRARQGTRSAPHYAGGGVVFGPHPRSYEQRLPKRMKRLALQGALTAKFGDGAIKVVDDLGLDAPKTRELVGYLDALKATGRVLVVATGQGRQARAVGAQPAAASSSSAPTRSTSSTSSTPTRCSSRSLRCRRCRRCTHDAPGVARSCLAPVISEKSMDETQRGKYTFRGPRRLPTSFRSRQRCRGALQGDRPGRQRLHHEGQGEVAATAAARRVKGWTSPWKKAVVTVGRRPEDRILRGGLGDAAAKLQANFARASVHDPLDVRGDHHRQAPQAAARVEEAHQRPQQRRAA